MCVFHSAVWLLLLVAMFVYASERERGREGDKQIDRESPACDYRFGPSSECETQKAERRARARTQGAECRAS